MSLDQLSRKFNKQLNKLFPHPIIQGPMAGGANTPAMVAAVSNSGALGASGVSMMSPTALREHVAQIRALTDKPFALNLFVQQTPNPSADEIAQGIALLKPIWSELGWESLPVPERWCENFDDQFATLLELRPAVASFTFNILESAQVAALHNAGILVVGTATTVAEALAWQAVGADAVVASGIESGGHRGTFLVPQTAATQSVWELGPEVCAALSIPVILAGGMMHGRDIAAAMKLGAQAVQMGTAFLVTDESGINPAYKQRLIDERLKQAGLKQENASQNPSATRLTRSFSGRYARALDNRFMQLMAAVEAQVPAYPIQNALTSGIRAAAGKAGQTEWMSMWAGMRVQHARPMPAAQLVAQLVEELEKEQRRAV
jgi:nitronate monooxygenase